MLDAYCTPLSVARGQPVALHVSTDAAAFDVVVTHDVAEPQERWHLEGVRGTEHPVPDEASSRGCGWPASLEIPIDEGWPSGYHAVTLTAGGERADACFVVRDGQPGAEGILAHKRVLALEDEEAEETERFEARMDALDREIADKEEEVKKAQAFLDQALFLLGEEVYEKRIPEPALSPLYSRLDRAR